MAFLTLALKIGAMSFENVGAAAVWAEPMRQQDDAAECCCQDATLSKTLTNHAGLPPQIVRGFCHRSAP